MWIFETTDYSNTPVVLSEETWQTKAGNHVPGSHPEIQPYLNDIKTTVENPDLVLQSTRDERAKMFYQLNAGRDMFIGKHLVVVVKYVHEQEGVRGYVSTMYLSRTIYSKGELLWKKVKQISQSK